MSKVSIRFEVEVHGSANCDWQYWVEVDGRNVAGGTGRGSPDDTFRNIRQVIEDQEYRIRRELRQKGPTT